METETRIPQVMESRNPHLLENRNPHISRFFVIKDKEIVNGEKMYVSENTVPEKARIQQINDFRGIKFGSENSIQIL